MTMQHLESINTVAECIGVSARRVRQFIEDGNVPRLEPGRVDLAWATYYATGAGLVVDWSRKPRDAKTLVALAWLQGVGNEPSSTDVAAFGGLFERNGFSRDEALLALGTARGLMARR